MNDANDSKKPLASGKPTAARKNNRSNISSTSKNATASRKPAGPKKANATTMPKPSNKTKASRQMAKSTDPSEVSFVPTSSVTDPEVPKTRQPRAAAPDPESLIISSDESSSDESDDFVPAVPSRRSKAGASQNSRRHDCLSNTQSFSMRMDTPDMPHAQEEQECSGDAHPPSTANESRGNVEKVTRSPASSDMVLSQPLLHFQQPKRKLDDYASSKHNNAVSSPAARLSDEASDEHSRTKRIKLPDTTQETDVTSRLALDLPHQAQKGSRQEAISPSVQEKQALPRDELSMGKPRMTIEERAGESESCIKAAMPPKDRQACVKDDEPRCEGQQSYSGDEVISEDERRSSNDDLVPLSEDDKNTWSQIDAKIRCPEQTPARNSSVSRSVLIASAYRGSLLT